MYTKIFLTIVRREEWIFQINFWNSTLFKANIIKIYRIADRIQIHDVQNRGVQTHAQTRAQTHDVRNRGVQTHDAQTHDVRNRGVQAHAQNRDVQSRDAQNHDPKMAFFIHTFLNSFLVTVPHC
jgi:hypothetical protein